MIVASTAPYIMAQSSSMQLNATNSRIIATRLSSMTKPRAARPQSICACIVMLPQNGMMMPTVDFRQVLVDINFATDDWATSLGDINHARTAAMTSGIGITRRAA